MKALIIFKEMPEKIYLIEGLSPDSILIKEKIFTGYFLNMWLGERVPVEKNGKALRYHIQDRIITLGQFQIIRREEEVNDTASN